MNRHKYNTEAGQSAVLFALVLVGLVIMIALAIDGGSVLNGRRVTQNAADSGALTGVHHIAKATSPNENSLQIIMNGVIESNGVPDTDGTPGNATNDNITVYYTDDRGNIMTSQPCYIVGDPNCGGAIPEYARGLSVKVGNQISTFFLGVIDRDTLDIGAGATAVIRGGTSENSGIEDNVLVAFGECNQAGDKPLDISTNNTDFIGGLHAATYFWNRGNDNHYHGQVTYGVAYSDTADVPPVYEPSPPALRDSAFTDPFASLGVTVDKFACDGEFGQAAAVCYDLEAAGIANGGVIDNQWLKTNDPGDGIPYLQESGPKSSQLRDGLYYLGESAFEAGGQGMVGTVSIVSENYIKITGEAVQLTGYMPSSSVLPGLLFYSSLHVPGEECTNYDQLDKPSQVAIDTTGSAAKATNRPGVYHSEDKPGCVNLENPSECYELGGLQYIGLIYASHGIVATSGDAATYVGSVVAYTIRVNGGMQRNGSNPQRVGALFVYDDTLFPPSEQFIVLDN